MEKLRNERLGRKLLILDYWVHSGHQLEFGETLLQQQKRKYNREKKLKTKKKNLKMKKKSLLASQWIPLWLSTQTIALTSGEHEEKYMKPSRPSALLSLQVSHHWKWTLPSGFHKLETYGLELMLLDCQAGLSLSSKHAESAKGICNSGTGDPNSIPIENYYICIYMYNWSSGAITLRSISYCTSWDLFVTFFCF